MPLTVDFFLSVSQHSSFPDFIRILIEIVLIFSITLGGNGSFHNIESVSVGLRGSVLRFLLCLTGLVMF